MGDGSGEGPRGPVILRLKVGLTGALLWASGALKVLRHVSAREPILRRRAD